MEIGCIMPARMDTPEHIELAEELGYTRAYVYDSPAIYADPWMILGLAASRTSTIRLAACVVTPRLRHVVANAGALATLTTLAPGRVDVGVGSGFTSAAMLRQPPTPWAQVESYITTLRALLAGEEVECDGALIALSHGAASGVRPQPVQILVAAHGPKAEAVAARVADGIVTNLGHAKEAIMVSGNCHLVVLGTVLDDGESLGDARVIEAAGPGAALALHLGPLGPAADLDVTKLYAERLAAIDEARRHIETHRGHLIEVTDLERDLITGELIGASTLTGTSAEVGGVLGGLSDSGAAGILYQPAGPDIPRELRAFAAASGLTGGTRAPVLERSS